MANEFLPYAKPDIGQLEIDSVVETLQSGWVTSGPKVKQFEELFSKFVGGGVEAIAVNSATAGLHLALEALGVGPGDEVIVPTYTFTATAEVVRYLGGDPVFVDVLSDSFNLDSGALERAITPRTKVVIPVHFAGLSCDMEAISAIAKKHGIRVVEDAAHALPTSCEGQLVGGLGSDFTVFSFYANKTMTTGEGGMITTGDVELAKRCRVMRLHGISKDAFDRYVSKTPAWFYEVVAPGYKYNMTDIAAAIGVQQLERLPSFQVKRERMAQVYNEALSDLPVIIPLSAPKNETHARHIYPLRISPDSGVTRDEFIERMSEKGVGCSVHFIPLHLQPYWRDAYSLSPDMFPVAQRLYEEEVSLPLYTLMSDVDQQRVIDAVREVFKDVKALV